MPAVSGVYRRCCGGNYLSKNTENSTQLAAVCRNHSIIVASLQRLRSIWHIHVCVRVFGGKAATKIAAPTVPLQGGRRGGMANSGRRSLCWYGVMAAGHTIRCDQNENDDRQPRQAIQRRLPLLQFIGQSRFATLSRYAFYAQCFSCLIDTNSICFPVVNSLTLV